MAKNQGNTNESSSGESSNSSGKSSPAPVQPTEQSLVDFCDSNGVNEVDRRAVYMKYGKQTKKTSEEWMSLLSKKITLNS